MKDKERAKRYSDREMKAGVYGTCPFWLQRSYLAGLRMGRKLERKEAK